MLCGSGEFTPAMADIDRELLEDLRAGARVAIIPTAAGREDTPAQWAARGSDHFRALGAEPVPVMVLDRSSAHERRSVEAVATADCLYFSGGDPGHLVETLEGTPFWAAVRARWRAGATLAGSSAGAMMLGETTFVPRGRDAHGMPTSVTTRPGLGVLSRVIVAPHFDILPAAVVAEWTRVWPSEHRLLAIDEDTALLQRDGGWAVRGRGRVQLFRTLEDVSVHVAGPAMQAVPLAALP